MESYRQIEDIQRRVTDLQRLLRSAILADTTRDMGGHTDQAHALAENIKAGIDALVNSYESIEGIEGPMVRAAAASIRDAILAAQRVALATNVDEMRARVLDFKTPADHVDAYLHAALGFQQE